MNIFQKLFGKKAASQKPAFKEGDNRGTRQLTFDQALAYWKTRNMRQKFDPFILYTFENQTSARQALLTLDCIHEAQDTHQLICTEPMIFGFYPVDNGQYEAILAGESLSHTLWAQAKAAFEKNGGQRKNDQEPVPDQVVPPPPVHDFSQVSLVKKYRDSRNNNYYEEYRCPDTELAKEYLLTRSVDQAQYYIVVETNNGNWGMDVKGLYKEHLLPWQTDVSSASVEGSTTGLPDTFSLEMAARGINDNFVGSVICGACGHQWMEGLRYQNWTVVECPSCKKRNKVNSESYHVSFVK